jgi:hypothetical protein
MKIPPHGGETKHGGLDMPTLVKEPVLAEPAATTGADRLGEIALVLAIVVATVLLASIFPLPPEIEASTDMFFAP